MSSVDPAYHHRAKAARPGSGLHWGGTYLKCYDLAETHLPVTQTATTQAKAYLETLPPSGASAGFIILHRCNETFHFLLLQVWRGNNEIWQSVHYADPPKRGFLPFAPAYPSLGHPRPTLCVWELGIAAHEAIAWQHYLASPRSENDFAIWQSDCLAAAV